MQSHPTTSVLFQFEFFNSSSYFVLVFEVQSFSFNFIYVFISRFTKTIKTHYYYRDEVTKEAKRKKLDVPFLHF